MRLPSLTNHGEFIEVPRWLPDGSDYSHLNGKRVFVEVAFGQKYHMFKIGSFSVHQRISDGRHAVDVSFPHPASDTLPNGYIFHLSPDQLSLVRPIEHGRYEYRYAGVLMADHSWASSFPSIVDAWDA